MNTRTRADGEAGEFFLSVTTLGGNSRASNSADSRVKRSKILRSMVIVKFMISRDIYIYTCIVETDDYGERSRVAGSNI